MCILLEGADMTGKSTLAQKLFELIPKVTGDAPVIQHFTKLPTQFDRYWGYKQHVKPDVILDRLHMSHVVYRSMDGEENTLTQLRYELIDALISQAGGLVVVMTLDDDELERRWSENPRKEMYALEQVKHVNALYRQIQGSRGLETRFGTYKMKVDLSFRGGLSTEDMAHFVIKEWQKRRVEMREIIDQYPGKVA